MASKLYTGHPSFGLQFFEKRSVLYVRTETFNVSVYDPCHTSWFFDIIILPGKKANDRARASAIQIRSPVLVEKISRKVER